MVFKPDKVPVADKVGGAGFTVIVNMTGVPVQPVAGLLGVTVMVAIKSLLPVLVAVKEGILPAPLAGRPIPGVVFTQLNATALPVKLMAVVGAPVFTVWFATAFTAGKAFTTPVTATSWFDAPAEANVILPDILPDAVAAERT